MHIKSVVLILTAAFFIGGCDGEPTKPEPTPKGKDQAKDNGSPTVDNNSKADQPAQVELQVAALDEILKTIEGQKGQVIVIDFWADFCIPCKKEFPNLVRLHKEWKDDGFVAMSVSLDDPEDKARTLEFLKDKGATFTNFLVKDYEKAQEHWDFTAIPAVVVYGRDGKIAKKFTYDDPNNQFTYEDVEKFVKPLVEKEG